MTAGLQLFDTDGSLSLDATFSLPKYIGIVMTQSASSGRVYIPLWETQQPWFVAMTSPVSTPNAPIGKVSVDGAYLVWSRVSSAAWGNLPIIVGHR